MHVLVVANESRVAQFTYQGLIEAGHAVDLATDSQAGLAQGLAVEYDAIVLDSNPPTMDGRHLLGKLRRRGRHTPVLILTRDALDECIEGLDGACDILIKPFALPELLVLLQTLVRRSALQTSPRLRQGNLVEDIALRKHLDERFRSLLELAPYATLIVNEQGRIVLVNWQVEQLFGYGRGEIVGQPIEILVPERFRGQHLQHRAKYMANPGVRPMQSRLDLYAVRQDGREFPAEVGLTPLVGEEGVLILATIRDITRRKEEEEKLRRSREQLRELSASLLTTLVSGKPPTSGRRQYPT
jgi:PAS domain S-box-containing protein